MSPASLMGPIRHSCIFVEDRLYRYINNQLWQVDKYDWTSTEAGQVGINLAIGGLIQWMGASCVMPMGPDSFTNMKMGVKSLKIWGNGAFESSKEATSIASALNVTMSSASINPLDPSQILVKFSEPLNKYYPANASWFSITNSGGNFTISNTEISGCYVILTTSRAWVSPEVMTLSLTLPTNKSLRSHRYDAPVNNFSATNISTAALAVPQFLRFNTLSSITESGNSGTGWIYTSTNDAFFAYTSNPSLSLPASGDGWVETTITTGASKLNLIGFRTTATGTNYSSFLFGLYAEGSTYYYVANGNALGVPNGTVVAAADGDKVRIQRANGVFTALVSKNGGTTWTTIHTSNNTNTQAQVYPAISVFTGLTSGPIAALGMI